MEVGVGNCPGPWLDLTVQGPGGNKTQRGLKMVIGSIGGGDMEVLLRSNH